MPEDSNAQLSQSPKASNASTPERPKPPRILEREPALPAKSLLQRLIERLAV
jgi:hypothetical protein